MWLDSGENDQGNFVPSQDPPSVLFSLLIVCELSLEFIHGACIEASKERSCSIVGKNERSFKQTGPFKLGSQLK